MQFLNITTHKSVLPTLGILQQNCNRKIISKKRPKLPIEQKIVKLGMNFYSKLATLLFTSHHLTEPSKGSKNALSLIELWLMPRNWHARYLGKNWPKPRFAGVRCRKSKRTIAVQVYVARWMPS